jgi:hypothetical protein
MAATQNEIDNQKQLRPGRTFPLEGDTVLQKSFEKNSLQVFDAAPSANCFKELVILCGIAPSKQPERLICFPVHSPAETEIDKVWHEGNAQTW